ncbi:hypothetical protein GCM10020255_008130 [Rhodococcus baikonurensis]
MESHAETALLNPESVEKWLHHVNTTISQPGQGNVGRITQLAIGGCQWLAEWTGNPAWTEGVTVAATSICDDVEDLKTDDARDAAEALMEHRAMYQDLWDGTGPRGETFAFPFPKDRGYDGPCKLAHEHSCEWVAILPSAWKKIAPELPFSRVKNTAFNLALAPGNDGKRLARKCRIPSKFAGGTEGTLIRAYVVCWHGVEYLAQPTPDAPPAPPTSDDTPPPSPQGPPTLPNTDTPPQPSVRADKTTSTRTATNAALKPSQPEPKFGSCSDPAVDIDETLSFAAAKASRTSLFPRAGHLPKSSKQDGTSSVGAVKPESSRRTTQRSWSAQSESRRSSHLRFQSSTRKLDQKTVSQVFRSVTHQPVSLFVPSEKSTLPLEASKGNQLKA